MSPTRPPQRAPSPRRPRQRRPAPYSRHAHHNTYRLPAVPVSGGRLRTADTPTITRTVSPPSPSAAAGSVQPTRPPQHVPSPRRPRQRRPAPYSRHAHHNTYRLPAVPVGGGRLRTADTSTITRTVSPPSPSAVAGSVQPTRPP